MNNFTYMGVTAELVDNEEMFMVRMGGRTVVGTYSQDSDRTVLAFADAIDQLLDIDELKVKPGDIYEDEWGTEYFVIMLLENGDMKVREMNAVKWVNRFPAIVEERLTVFFGFVFDETKGMSELTMSTSNLDLHTYQDYRAFNPDGKDFTTVTVPVWRTKD